ncbi:GNAT family N-acetyltransferase [Halomonas aquamarina]|uniref:GNAT family N-acetyltransferase n=1 Tax=Vreelandella aquamarina TaxID=77097 RepID=A0ACC5VQC6_9GAMM|nr:GNAT family protein [Halomonas aquamarina]MBZ5486088.1 GNAT family N-acetyltransferase [Halomonas aquamarina]
MFITEQQLEGQHIILEHLHSGHIEPLQQAVAEGEAWKIWYANVPHPDDMAAYVESAMEGAKKGEVAYAVRHKASGDIVGTTRFYQVDAANRRAMLGYTWYSQSVRRTAVNTECKYLMLQNLFEASNAVACEFRTHFFNQASRTAIERLGAKQDGILRSHQIMRDGSLRDTVVYSIIEAEWPAVRMHLESKLESYLSP